MSFTGFPQHQDLTSAVGSVSPEEANLSPASQGNLGFRSLSWEDRLFRNAYTGHNEAAMKTRREFLLSSAAMALALRQKAEAAPDTATGEWRNKQSGIAYRRLGRTGYMISEVVMGGNTIAPDNYEHVLLALDMGLNYLDTAPAYGNTRSELGYAKVIAARPRDSFFHASSIRGE